MSFNNLIPAKFLIDQSKEAELSHPDYIKWLNQRIEETGDFFYIRRLEIVTNGRAANELAT